MTTSSTLADRPGTAIPPGLRRLLTSVGLLAFVGVGVFVEWRLLQRKPLDRFLIEDFTYYARGFRDALHAGDPYLVRDIGRAFIYPPQALILLLPAFAAAKVSPVFVVLLNLALAIALPLLVARRFSVPLRTAWWWPIVTVFFGPTLEAIHVGQVNLMVCVALVFLLHPRARVAGAGLAVAVLIKFTPVAFVSYLAAARRWKAAAWAAVCGAVPTVLMAVWLGPGVFRNFADVMRNLLGSATPSQFSAFGRLSGPLHLAPSDARLVQALVMAWCVVLLGVSVLAAWRTRDGLPTFLAAGFLLPVASSIVWYHHLTFLLLPAFVWIAASKTARVTAWNLAGLALVQLDPSARAGHLFAHVSAVVVVAVQVAAVRKLRRAPAEVRVCDAPVGSYT